MTSQIGYLKLLITRSILSGPLNFEIKRVACIFVEMWIIVWEGSRRPCKHCDTGFGDRITCQYGWNWPLVGYRWLGSSLQTNLVTKNNIWAASWENQQNRMWAHRRLRSAWCPGWSESLLGAHSILLVFSWYVSFHIISVLCDYM